MNYLDIKDENELLEFLEENKENIYIWLSEVLWVIRLNSIDIAYFYPYGSAHDYFREAYEFNRYSEDKVLIIILNKYGNKGKEIRPNKDFIDKIKPFVKYNKVP